VVRKMTTNRLKVQMTPSMVTATETDFSCGSVTFQNIWRRVAPSTLAASYRSAGIDCRPPSRATIMNGTPSQTLTTIGATYAQNVSESQFGPWIPNSARNRLMNPYSPLNR
jgi:hypothetical protein